MSFTPIVVALASQLALFAPPPAADTIDVGRLDQGPAMDGRVDEREYGAPSLRISTAAGVVKVWLARHGDFIYVAAELPDSSFYWGDDFVVSLDPEGDAGQTPGDGDRQWYLRRTLDSSVISIANAGRWSPPGASPPMLGTSRHHAEWDVASTSSAGGWMVELRVRSGVVKRGRAAPRLALRTYNDQPSGWWSWPVAPAGVPAQRVERSPALWTSLHLP